MINLRPVVHIVASSLSAVTVFVLIALCAGPGAAQSGRRATRSSSPAPAPTPETAPVAKKVGETKAELSLVVGIDRGENFSIPIYLYDTVLRACAERLDDSPSFKVDANRDMNRGDAVKRAKAETESDVVWLQLSSDNGRTLSSEDLRDVLVEYWVFAPTTAKVINHGRIYQQAYGAGGVTVIRRPGSRDDPAYTEQLLKQAAREAAEQILAALNVSGRKAPG